MGTILYHRFAVYEPLTNLSNRWYETLGSNATDLEMLSEQRVLRLAFDTWFDINSFELTDELVLWYNTVVVAMADAYTESDAKKVVEDGFDRLMIKRLALSEMSRTQTGVNIHG
jgi:hypothetical protein